MKLTDLTHLSPKHAAALNKEGIFSPFHLLHFFPFRYLDKSNIQSSSAVTLNEHATIIGTVVSVETVGFGKSKRLEVAINDGFGFVKGVWFKGIKFFVNQFKPGETVAFFGIVKAYGKTLSMAHPVVDKVNDRSASQGFKEIVPIYPGGQNFSKARINSKLLNSWIKNLFNRMAIDEFLPRYLLDKYQLPELREAYRMIHFPVTLDETEISLFRFKFEELFLFQLCMQKIRIRLIKQNDGIIFDKPTPLTSRFFSEIFPYALTDGQKSTLRDIKEDIRSGKQMNRLVQGDVGSGKTLVAAGTIMMALDNGYQAALLAPTEILAEQHFHTLRGYFEALNIPIRLLVGGQAKRLRREILADLSAGVCPVVVGTHAIIQKEVQFNRLGLAVIDEQHRFGVQQRSVLLEKGSKPHILVMSATPIPRSLAMTVYGDLDVSLMKDMPKGRIPIKTAVRKEAQREEVLAFLYKELKDGAQAYIVYPLVEESELLDLKDATEGFAKLRRRFPEIHMGLIHGRMKSQEKEQLMQEFQKGAIQLLISTTVIEVGVDVPNATIMIVEHAERFGLSQLHQLRGRVGRGGKQSYCILMADSPLSKPAVYRLKVMAETTDGFAIAEADLKLRGPGDFMGTKQSGLPDFKVADILKDQELMETAKKEAEKLLEADFELEEPSLSALKSKFHQVFKDKSFFYKIG